MCYRQFVYLPSVARVDQSKTKLCLCNFHHTIAPSLWFLRNKFNPEIPTGSPEQGRQTRAGGKSKPFSSFKRQYLENGKKHIQGYY